MKRTLHILMVGLIVGMLYAPNHLQAAEIFFSKESAEIGGKCVELKDNKLSNKCTVDLQVKVFCGSVEKHDNLRVNSTKPMQVQACTTGKQYFAACAYDPQAGDKKAEVAYVSKNLRIYRCKVYSSRSWSMLEGLLILGASRNKPELLQELLGVPSAVASPSTVSVPSNAL